MFTRHSLAHAAALAVASLLTTPAAHAQTPLSTAFTYQGELAGGGSAATGTYDLRFRLYDASTGGNQIGSALCSDDLPITNGRFSLSLDFGAAAFAGQQRFLEVEVRADTGLDCSDSTGFTVLTPRQELTATPYAAYAQAAATAVNAASLNGQSAGFYHDAANLTGTVVDARLSSNVARLNGNQTFTGLFNFSNPANVFSGVFSGSGLGLTSLNGANIIPASVGRSALSTDVQDGLGTRTTGWGAPPYRTIGSVATAMLPRSVAVSGSYAYVVNYDSSSLQIFNISNPAAPTLAGSIQTDVSPNSVAVLGSYAYVVNVNSNTLQIFNITNPAAPALAGSVGTVMSPYSVAVSGSYAYVVSTDPGTLQVFNITNPASPTLAGSIATGQGPFFVAVSGSYAYVVNYISDALQIFNVSNPAAPTLAGSIGTASGPYCVAVSGSYAHVVNSYSGTLQVFNISNPAAPSLAGSIAAAGYPFTVAALGSYAYVASIASDTLEVFAGTAGMEFNVPLAASSLLGTDGSGLINLDASKISTGTISQSVLPASAWTVSQIGSNAITSGGGTFTAVNGSPRTIAMRQGVAVVGWSTTAYTNSASTGFDLRVRAVTNGVATLGPASTFFFNQASVHMTISGNAVISIPSTGNTVFSLEVTRRSGAGAYQTDLNDSLTASIINLGQ